MSGYKILIFGASGAIGRSLCEWHHKKGYDVLAVVRSADRISAAGIQQIIWSGDLNDPGLEILNGALVDGVVWAQGLNINDNPYTFNVEEHEKVYEANVLYVLKSLQLLLRDDRLSNTARLVVISSIWQNISRPNKLTYSVTKSALKGLVQSLAIDLGQKGMFINAVLPGALDTPMTRKNLAEEQIKELIIMTPLKSMPSLDDVASLTEFLCSPANSGITGQFISADKGFSYAKII